MPYWSVQCVYPAYHDCEITVEADTLEDALEKAIEAADAQRDWRDTLDCGATYVGAVAEGAGVRPWGDDFRSLIAVPPTFSEHGLRPHVTITIDGSSGPNVTIENGPCTIELRDYDQRDPDPAKLSTDENGRAFVSSLFPPPSLSTAPAPSTQGQS
jgi:hypothetical protein